MAYAQPAETTEETHYPLGANAAADHESPAERVAPALHVARLVQERQSAAAERLEQELNMAHAMQLALLPQTIPAPPGWRIETLYRPARAVGGDFFDFVELDENRLGVLIGDVTGKGMPAALIMASTSSILRLLAEEVHAPGEVLRRANNLLVRDIPPGFFVTCLYAVINTATGETTFANAGHNPPFERRADGVHKLDAVGMPLRLMADMDYVESTVTLGKGGCVLLYSDGITEAHDEQRRMYGFPRLQALLDQYSRSACPSVLDALMQDLTAFTGGRREQEDDITLLALHHL